MVMIELVYCRITGKTRSLPKIHHFVPIEPWSVRKIKGKQRVMNIGGGKNEEQVMTKKYERRKDTVKLVLDMSNDGPIFRMLESMVRDTANSANAYEALKKLLQSGIPGISELFGTGKDNIGARFKNMTDEDKAKFLAAVTGAGGKIQGQAAAVLIAAAASGGNPDIANKIVERMMSGLGDEIDPAMMAALMTTTALVAQGASNEEILKAMQEELAKSGLSKEEILAKTMLLQKALTGDNSPAFINKTLQNALNAANISPEELAKALLIQKAMGAGGTSPEDLAKAMLIQKLLAEKGVSNEMIAQALKSVVGEGGTGKGLEELIKIIQAGLNEDGISIEDIANALALSKVIETGKVRGIRDIYKLLEDGALNSAEAIADALRQAIATGKISPDALAHCMIVQKLMKALGVTPEGMAKSLALEKTLQENGMTKNDVANAMSLTMAIGLDGLQTKKDIEIALQELLDAGGLTPEEVETLNAITKAMETGAEIPPEAVRLLRKAMKQRRGSVDNVAETLMASLSDSGESQESVVKAMVKALKATGASPEEIARTMQQALEKSGASKDDIARAMAQALIDSGASAEEVARTLKETFAKTIADDPSTAPEVARTMAEALAAAGASPQDIARTMKEILRTGLAKGKKPSTEDILEMAETIAGVLADAGALPEDIADAMQIAMDMAKGDSDLAEELAKTMAQAMADAGTSGEQIADMMRDVLKKSGFSKRKAALLTLQAVAGSGASPEDIAKAINKLQVDTGLTSEEIEQALIDAMVESGASAEDVVQAMAQHKLLQAVGQSAEKASKELLKALRSGKNVSKEKVMAVLQSAGITSESATKLVGFQKALGALQANPEDVAEILLIQKKIGALGAPPETVVRIMKEIGSGHKLSEHEIENLISTVVYGDLDHDDVLKGIKLDSVITGNQGLDPTLVNILKDVEGALSKKETDKIAQELLKSGCVDAKAVAMANILQQIMAEFQLPPDEASKFIQIQKSMYDAGASPQDIAMLLNVLNKDNDQIDREALAQGLRDKLHKGITAADVSNAQGLADAFQHAAVDAETVQKMAMVQNAIANGLKTPEQGAKKLADIMKNPNADLGQLQQAMKSLLKENGLTLDSLEKSVLMQRVAFAGGSNPDDLASVISIQGELLDSGVGAKAVAAALQDLIQSDLTGLKDQAKVMLSALDKGRLQEEDVLMSSKLFKSMSKVKKQNEPNLGMTNGHVEPTVALSKKAIQELIKQAMTKHDLSTKAMASSLLMQKVMASGEASAEELAKVCRIQKTLIKNGAPAKLICKTIGTLLEGQKSGVADKMKKPLQDVLNDQPFKISGTEIEFAKGYLNAMTNSNQDPKKVKEVLASALSLAGLSDEDVAKAMLVQKTLAAAGVSPEAMAQVMQLQKALADSGASPEEIANLLSQAIGDGLSDKQIEDIMGKVLQNKNLSADEVENIMKLQESLKSGSLAKSGITTEAMDQIMILKAALKAAGANESEIIEALAAAASSDLTESEVSDLMSKVLAGKGIDEIQFKNLSRLQNTLENGNFKAMGLTPEVIEQLETLEKALRASGANEATIRAVLAKATTKGLSKKEIDAIISQAMNPSLSKEQEKIMKDLHTALKSDELVVGGLKKEAAKELVALKRLLEKSGLNEHEVRSILEKVTLGDGLSETEMADLLTKAKDSGLLSKEDLAELGRLESALEEGKLSAPGLTPEILDQLLQLEKAMQAAGASDEEISRILSKATTEGLATDEINAIIRQALKSDSLTKEDKQKIKQLEDNLHQGNLKVGGLSQDKMEEIILLEKVLAASGASKEDIADLIAKAMTGDGLSKDEIAKIMGQAKTARLSDDEKKKLAKLEKELQSGTFAQAGVTPNVIDKILNLKAALKDSGKSEAEILHLLSKATTSGLEDKEVLDVMSNAINSNMTKKQVEDLKNLQDTLGKGTIGSGIDHDSMEKIVLLQKALKAAGKTDEEIADIISKATSAGGLANSEIDKIIDEAKSSSRLTQEERNALDDLEKSLKDGALENKGLSATVIDQMLLLQKTLEATGASPIDIINTLMKATGEGLDKSEIKAILTKAEKSNKLSKSDKAKLKQLQKDLEQGNLQVGGITGGHIEDILQLKEALKASGASEEEIQAVLSKVMHGATDLKPKEVEEVLNKLAAFANQDISEQREKTSQLERDLKDKALSNPALTKPVIDQLLQLKKILKASGLANDEIANILTKATNEGLSKEEIALLINKAMKSPNLSDSEKKKLKELKKSLENDSLKVGGVNKNTIEKLLLIENALEESGASDEQIAEILAKATGSGLSGDEIAMVMAAAESSLDDKEAAMNKRMKKLQEKLNAGDLNIPGLTGEVLEQLLFLKSILKSSGASDDEIARWLAKVASEGLTKDEIALIMEGAIQDKKLSKEDKAKLKNLRLSLERGKLKVEGGIDQETMEDLILLQNGLERSGADAKEIANVLKRATGTAGGISKKERQNIMANATKVAQTKFDQEEQEIDRLEQDLLAGNLVTKGMTKEIVSDIVALQQALKASGASEEEIKRVVKQALSGNLNQSDIDELISKAMESDKLTVEEKRKLKALKAKLESGGLKVDGIKEDAIDQLVMMQNALAESGANPEDVIELLTKATSKEGLTKEDIHKIINNSKEQLERKKDDHSKRMKNLEKDLTSNVLSNPQMTPQVLDQMMLLEKTLEAAGTSKEEIAHTLAKVTSGQLDKDEIDHLMSKAMNAKGISKEDKAKLNQLKENLLKGNLNCQGVSESAMEDLLLLQKALEASGMKATDIQRVLTKVISEGLNDKEIKDIMENAMNSSNLSKKDKQKLKALQKTLEEDKLKGVNLTAKGVDEVMNLKKVLQESGVSEEDLARILSKATKGELSESDKADIVFQAMTPTLSEEDREKLKQLETSLKDGKLRLGGINKKKADHFLLLMNTLEQAGASPEEVAQVLAKAMGEGLDNKEISSIMAKALSNPNLTPKDKKKLLQLQAELEEGNLRTAGVTPEVIDQLVLLQKAMMASGYTDEAIAQAIEKITKDGLSPKEIDELISKAMSSNKLSKEDKDKLADLKRNLENGNLTLQNVRTQEEGIKQDTAKQLMLLKEVLEKAGANPEEMAEILAKALKGKLGKEEISNIMEKAMANPNLSPNEKQELQRLQANLEKSKLKTEGVTPQILDQLILVQKAMKASGYSDQEIAQTIEKITKDGLAQDEINKIIKMAMTSTKLSKEDKDQLQDLKESLEEGRLKVTPNNDKGGLKKDTADKLLLLQDVLEKSGASPQEISDILAKAVSNGLSNKEIESIMDKALSDINLTEEERAKLEGLRGDLEKGSLKTEGLSPKIVEQLMLVEKVMKAAGKSDEEIAQTLARITKDGLSKAETDDMISNALNSNKLSEEDKKKLKNLKNDLIKGGLRVAPPSEQDGIKAETANKLLLLKDVLEKSGVSPDKVVEILSKAMGDALNNKEITQIIAEALANPNLTEEEKKQLSQLETDLQRGNLKTEGVTPNTLDQLLLVQKVMKASGSSDEEIAKTLEKITRDGLTKDETDKLIAKAMGNTKLSKEDKEKLKDLKEDLLTGNLIVSNTPSDAIEQLRLLKKTLEDSGASPEEIKEVLALAASGKPLDSDTVDHIMAKALKDKKLSPEEYKALKKLQDDLKSGKLKTPGVDKEIMEKVLLLQQVLEDSGASPEEIANIIAKATSSGLSDETINGLMSKVLNNENLTTEQRKKFLDLESDLKGGKLKLSDKVVGSIDALLSSGQIDKDTLAKALMVQKLLANAGLNPDDLSKAAMVQKAMMDAGASPEAIAKALQESLNASGIDMDQFTRAMEKELKANKKPTADDVLNGLEFHKSLGADSAAQAVLRKMKPEHLKLLEELSKSKPGQIKDTESLIKAMKEALGDSLDDATLRAMEVSALMEKAGASKDEIEEMMAMMMNKSGGISSEFLNDIKKAMESKGTPKDKMKMLQRALDDEINSLTNTLRNTFLNKVPTKDEISKACDTLAEKLSADSAAKNDVRCGLMDIIDEALQDVTDFEPDANMVFNYLMMSALAEAADAIEKQGIKKPTGAELQDMARLNMLEMIRRMLAEAELPDEMRKLDVYGRSIEGIKELLNHLLNDPHTSNQLRRQVAFLFDFDEIQHTTILGMALQDILKDAKHKLRPWELTKNRRIKGYRRAKMPKLAYSQVYCYYKVLPDHVDGPPIGVTYE